MNHTDLGFTDKWLSKRIKESKEFREKYRINSSMMDFGVEIAKDNTKENDMNIVNSVVFSQEGLFINNIPNGKIVREINSKQPIYRIMVKALAVFGYIYISDDIRLYVVEGEKRVDGNNYLLSKVDEDDLLLMSESLSETGNSPKIPIDGVKVISDTRIHQGDSPASRIMTNNLIHTLCGNANKIKGQ